MKRRYTWGVVVGLAIIAAASLGWIMSQVEQAKYMVLEFHNNFEIRDYEPMIVAEVDVTGKREDAIKQGFRIIADYIFGDNTPTEKVAMAAPVTQTKSDKIAMTAPVIQQGDGTSWKIRFVMPAAYQIDTLPKPNNDAVKLKEFQGRRFSVIRFSGLASNENLQEHEKELRAFIKERNLKPLSLAIYAFYNPPWTLPFLRRNEIMIEVAK